MKAYQDPLSLDYTEGEELQVNEAENEPNIGELMIMCEEWAQSEEAQQRHAERPLYLLVTISRTVH